MAGTTDGQKPATEEQPADEGRAARGGRLRRPRRAGRSTTAEQDPKPRRSAGDAVAKVRTRLGQLVWLVAVLAALLLAIGALLVALDANESNRLVELVLSGADAVDLGIFSREPGQGIFDFTGENAETKRALVNWGIGAVAWLVVGKVVERLVRP